MLLGKHNTFKARSYSKEFDGKKILLVHFMNPLNLGSLITRTSTESNGLNLITNFPPKLIVLHALHLRSNCEFILQQSIRYTLTPIASNAAPLAFSKLSAIQNLHDIIFIIVKKKTTSADVSIILSDQSDGFELRMYQMPND